MQKAICKCLKEANPMRRLFTSESVTEGHPDKICDQISDAILDTIIAQDPEAHVACETCTTTGLVMIMGEVTTTATYSAEDIARMLKVSDKFIAITVLAIGTSLPEFVTSLVALAKHRSQMALGNILGSNVFNILLILGTSALICPMSFAAINFVDFAALVLSALLVYISVYTGKRNMIDRVDGAIMLVAFAAYMVWLFITL